MEGFGPEKLVFILLILLLVFGARRLPEIGASLGKGIREFRKSVQGDEPFVSGQPTFPATQSYQPQASQVTAAPPVPVQPAPVPGATTQA